MKSINIWEERLQTQITNAIKRSESHNEIVHLEIDGDSVDALAAIAAITDCETDYNMSDYQGEDRLDIWGSNADAQDGAMLWRLNITFTNNI
jgi:hypothetical protein